MLVECHVGVHEECVSCALSVHVEVCTSAAPHEPLSYQVPTSTDELRPESSSGVASLATERTCIRHHRRLTNRPTKYMDPNTTIIAEYRTIICGVVRCA